MAIEVLEGQGPKLCLDVTAPGEHRALGNACHEIALHPAEGGAEEIEQCDDAEDHAELREVDALPRGHVHPGEELAQLSPALEAEPSNHLRLAHPRRQRLADDAVEDDVGRVADDPWRDHREGDARRREHCRQGDTRDLGTETAHQLTERLTWMPRGLRRAGP